MKYLFVLFFFVANNLYSQTYTYDAKNQLTKVTYSTGAVLQYTYDAVGNRVTELYSPSGVLPVRLTNFTIASQNCNTAILQWQTAQEHNSKGFELQQSTDAGNFTKLAFIASNNNRNGNSYSYPVTNTKNGNYYFRLKQIDQDGSFAYSKIVTVKVNCNNNKITIQPNPVKKELTIQGAVIDKNTVIRIYDSKGAVVQTIKNSVNNAVNVSQLPAGMYMLQINNSESFKFVKE